MIPAVPASPHRAPGGDHPARDFVAAARQTLADPAMPLAGDGRRRLIAPPWRSPAAG